jgi:hypothetical protein
MTHLRSFLLFTFCLALAPLAPAQVTGSGTTDYILSGRARLPWAIRSCFKLEAT